MSDLEYLLACAEAHADKFPVPDHMRLLVARVRAALPKGEPDGWKPQQWRGLLIQIVEGMRRFDRRGGLGLDTHDALETWIDGLEAMIAAAPPAGDERPSFAGVSSGVSPETRAALDAIDANIRAAAIAAPNIIVGAAPPAGDALPKGEPMIHSGRYFRPFRDRLHAIMKGRINAR